MTTSIDTATIRRSGFRRFAAMMALGALFARALIPLGYMPGNLAAGEFMVLCPSGLPGITLHTESHAHTHGEHHSGAMVDADRACPIGVALAYAHALPTDVAAFELGAPLRHAQPNAPTAVFLPRFRATAFRPRAPPIVSS